MPDTAHLLTDIIRDRSTEEGMAAVLHVLASTERDVLRNIDRDVWQRFSSRAYPFARWLSQSDFKSLCIELCSKFPPDYFGLTLERL